jgi:DNA-binding transcriptional MerR regulator
MMKPPPDRTKGLTLDDLAKAANREPRTIRSWIAQELLPPPLTRGPAARYPAEAIQRLQTIIYLKDELGMSLDAIGDAIGRELRAPSPEKIVDRLAKRSPQLPRAKTADRNAALDYIGRLRKEGPKPGTRDLFEPSSPTDLEPLERRLGDPKPAGMRRSRVEDWLRIPITPDLELSARRSRDPKQREQLERCANLIRSTLLGS